jgi:hypothetical protein
MKDAGLRKKVVGQLFGPAPGHLIPLAPSPERAPPEIGDTVTKRMQCTTIGRHCMVRKEAGYDLPQPFPLLGNGMMHSPSHLFLDFLELRPHSVTSGFSLKREPPAS